MKTYKAPWSALLIVMSLLATVLCIGIAFSVCFLPGPVSAGWLGTALRWLPVILLPGAALFIVRGYTITPDTILIHRLFWNTRLPREGLQSAGVEPGAMRKSIRTCGNGGLFSFTGWYWSKSLKSYRAFVTDLNRTVVLRYKRRTFVVSPNNPEDFVRALDRPVRDE